MQCAQLAMFAAIATKDIEDRAGKKLLYQQEMERRRCVQRVAMYVDEVENRKDVYDRRGLTQVSKDIYICTSP